jgi:hypothetical protein
MPTALTSGTWPSSSVSWSGSASNCYSKISKKRAKARVPQMPCRWPSVLSEDGGRWWHRARPECSIRPRTQRKSNMPAPRSRAIGLTGCGPPPKTWRSIALGSTGRDSASDQAASRSPSTSRGLVASGTATGAPNRERRLASREGAEGIGVPPSLYWPIGLSAARGVAQGLGEFWQSGQMSANTKLQGELIAALFWQGTAGKLDFDRVAQTHGSHVRGSAAAATSVQRRSMSWSQRR